MVNEKELAKASNHVGKNDRKTGMSCAECRRSKLKCDRTFPCSACVRRGCANICPDGTLTATKGNKVLQSQNETLMHNVKRLKARVRELEDALAKTQAQISPQPHPLLEGREQSNEPEISENTCPKDEVEEASDLVGSLSIGEQGQARFHGQSSASEFLQTLLPHPEDDPSRTLYPQNMYRMGLPSYLIDLINAFPFNHITPDPEAKSAVLRYLPNHNKALALTLLYFENGDCSYQVLQQDTFVSHLFEVLLESTKGLTVGEKLHAHQLAVIYMVLAQGSILSEDENDRGNGEKYYLLACAAMSLSPIIKETTSASLQVLFLMVQYFNAVDSPACERRWLWSGVMYRMVYSIGLQRDPALWGLSAEETQRRRTLFWEIYTWDAFKSILYGRPPSLNINYTDCKFPEDKSEIYNANGEREMGFLAYKHRFGAFILTHVVNHIFGVRQQNYSAVLEVDTKLRKLPPPSWLLAPTRGKGEPVDGRAWDSSPGKAMQQYFILSYREATLLYIHRRYFATAIKLNPMDPLQNKYGASVMAACRSACLLLSSLRSLYGAYPCLASKQHFFWSGAFSSIIVLCCLVYNAPGCKLAGDAMRAIDDGVELYSMRLFDDNSPSKKLLASVRESVQNMLDNYKRHIRHSKDEFVVDHGSGECSTMRILEGNSVLINMNEYKSSNKPACSRWKTPDGSSPSSTSEQSEGAHESPEASHNEWSGSGSGSGASISSEEGPDFRMLDFSGVYYAPATTQVDHVPAFSAPSPYMPVENAPEERPTPTATEPVFLQKVNGQIGGGLAVPQNGAMYQAQAPVIYPPSSEPVLMMPPYGAPGMQYEPTTGMGDMYLLNQNGYVAQTAEVYDQATWENFMREMGMPNTNV